MNEFEKSIGADLALHLKEYSDELLEAISKFISSEKQYRQHQRDYKFKELRN